MAKEFKGTPGNFHIDNCPVNGFVITNEDESKAVAFLPLNSVDSEYNSILFAAAPELLEACQEALKELMFHDWANTTTGFKLVNAINQALGE